MGRELTMVGAALVAACSGAETPHGTVAPERPPPASAAAPGATAVASAEPPPAAAPPAEPPDEVSAACAPYDAALAKDLAPYLDAFATVGLELSPDGKTALFTSDRGGTSQQLHVGLVAKPGEATRVLAPAKDRVVGARFTPDGKYVLFARDRDNDENYQIYRATPDGNETVDLTANPQRVHTLPHASRDGKLYYIRADHKSKDVEILEQPLAGGAERIVYRGSGFHSVSDLSSDGTRLLVTHILSPSRSRTLLVDVASGAAKPIGAEDGADGHVRGARFAPDGKSIFVIGDVGEARASLWRLDESGQERLARWGHDAREVEELQVAPRGDTVAATLHQGSHVTLALFDGATLKPRGEAKLALGTLRLGRFSADGRSLVASVSTPAAPFEPMLVDARAGAARALRKDERPGLGALAKLEATVERAESFDGTRVPMNVYRAAAGGNARRPVLVSVHGGPASASTIRWSPFTGFFVARGWAVVEPNIRGSTGFGKDYERADNGPKRMDALRDLERVNEWVKKQPWADPDRVVVYGGSYGGYMTYMALGHQPDRWRAGVGLVGIVNLKTFMVTTAQVIREAFREEFGELEKDAPFLDSISPLRVLDRVRAPLFVYQGATDPRVPRAEQDQLVGALRQRRHPVEYMIAPDEGHSLSHRHTQLAFLSRVHRFLDVHLGRPGVPAACAAIARP
jgi:dipeptidyl aminopeptidase/acylaminoacyl peptidase